MARRTIKELEAERDEALTRLSSSLAKVEALETELKEMKTLVKVSNGSIARVSSLCG
jgi:hypothetical protein